MDFYVIDYWTPLHLACQNNHYQIIQFLLRNGAELNPKDKWGSTPMFLGDDVVKTHLRKIGGIE